MHTKSAEQTGRFVVAGAEIIRCQSPAVCKNAATHLNVREQLYLCDECQEMLDRMQWEVSQCA
jgi:hypothetical protein